MRKSSSESATPAPSRLTSAALAFVLGCGAGFLGRGAIPPESSPHSTEPAPRAANCDAVLTQARNACAARIEAAQRNCPTPAAPAPCPSVGRVPLYPGAPSCEEILDSCHALTRGILEESMDTKSALSAAERALTQCQMTNAYAGHDRGLDECVEDLEQKTWNLDTQNLLMRDLEAHIFKLDHKIDAAQAELKACLSRTAATPDDTAADPEDLDPAVQP